MRCGLRELGLREASVGNLGREGCDALHGLDGYLDEHRNGSTKQSYILPKRAMEPLVLCSSAGMYP